MTKRQQRRRDEWLKNPWIKAMDEFTLPADFWVTPDPVYIEALLKKRIR